MLGSPSIGEVDSTQILWNSSSTPKKVAPRIPAEKDLSLSAFCLFVLFVWLVGWLFVCFAVLCFALLCSALFCFVLFVCWVFFFAEISSKIYGRSLVVESQIPRYWEVDILEASTLLLVRSLSKKSSHNRYQSWKHLKIM